MRCINFMQAQKLGLKKLGTVVGNDLSHAIYLAHKYSNEKPEYYVMELAVRKNGLEGMLVSFWKKAREGGRNARR